MRVQKRIITTIGMFGAVTLLLAGVVGYPAAVSILTLRDKIMSENLKIEERYLRRQQIKKAIDTLETAKAAVGKLEAMALREGRELEFVSALEAIASDTHLDQKIQLETANQKNISKWEREIPLTLTLAGRYQDVLAYIDRVERLPYAIMVGNIDISAPRASTNNPEGMVQARIDGTVYWQSNDAPSFLKSVR